MATKRLFFSNLRRVLRADVQLLPEGGVQFQVPGLAYADLMRTGVPGPWVILKSLETGFWLPRQTGQDVQLYPKVPHPDSRLVIICQRLHLSPSFYEHATLGHSWQFKTARGPNSSKMFSVFMKQTDLVSDALMLTCQRLFAYINPQTLEILPILDDAVKCPSPGASLMRVHISSIPERHFLWRMRVAHSDTDYANHVNQSSYLRFCLDAAAEATSEGVLKKFKRDIFEYKLKEADLLYQGQSFAGQDLEIFVWEAEDPGDYSAFFQIKREDINIVFARITFYANDEP